MFLLNLIAWCLAAFTVEGNENYERHSLMSPYYHERPYYRERTNYIRHQDGGKQVRDYDESRLKRLLEKYSDYEDKDFDSSDYQYVKDLLRKNRLNRGHQSSSHAVGDKEDHAKKSHDRGYYEKEKEYGYEKSYGYEREVKSHDKAAHSESHGHGYDHGNGRKEHEINDQFLRDLAEENRKRIRGSNSRGRKNELRELISSENRETDYNNFPNSRFFKRSGPIMNYSPNFVPKKYSYGIDESLKRFRQLSLSGIHGLGGIRMHGLNYGYNPLRYRINDFNINFKKPFSELEDSFRMIWI